MKSSRQLKITHILLIPLFLSETVRAQFEEEFENEDFLAENVSGNNRSGKYIPILAVIRLPTGICTINNQKGACRASKHCKRDGGMSLGRCGNGYGVCCVLTATCSATNNQQPTIIRTSGTHLTQPAMITTPTMCQFELPKREGTCQAHLDFVNFNLDPPNPDGNCPTDRMTITGSVNLKKFMTCGTATGQHLYLHYGSSNTILVNLHLVNALSSYDILVTYIPCSSTSFNGKRKGRNLFSSNKYSSTNNNYNNIKYNPTNNNPVNDVDIPLEPVPYGCSQYYTRSSDMVKSFNFIPAVAGTPPTQHQINNQMYTVCVKPTSGSTQITWSPCTPTGSFFVSGTQPPAPGTPPPCQTDYVDIPGSTSGRYCRSSFPPMVTSMAKPYIMYVNFDGEELFGINLPQNPATGCPLGYDCWLNGVPQPDPTLPTYVKCDNSVPPTPGVPSPMCVLGEDAQAQSDFTNTGFCLQYNLT